MTTTKAKPVEKKLAAKKGKKEAVTLINFLLDKSPDPVHIGEELRTALESQIAGAFEGNAYVGRQPSRMRREDEHTVGQVDGLVNLVRNKEHCLAALLPDL